MKSPKLLAASFWVAPLLLTACGDPGGPELAGTINLGSGVDASSFKSMHVRVYPDPGGAFDASAIPSSAYSQVSAASEPFPRTYRLGQGLGTSPNASWRLVAWLSHHDELQASVLPEKGDVLCTAVATLKGCGTYGGYCGEADGVNCTLTTPLP